MLARTDLVQLCGKWTQLRQCGREHVGTCPFHKEKTPSFYVVPGKGFYHCFGCGAHGNAFDFVLATEGIRFPDAVAMLAAHAGVALPDRGVPKRQRTPIVCQPADPRRDAKLQQERRGLAHRIWRQRTPFAGSLAETYLVEARGIPAALVRGCTVLGFVPAIDYWAQAPGSRRYEAIWRGPALLAALQYADGKFAAVHITYLQPDGSDKLILDTTPGEKRTARKVRGVPGSAAIRLTPPGPMMAVGEGIETTLSAQVEFNHAWAAYSLDNLAGKALAPGSRDPRDRRRRLPSAVPDMARPSLTLPPECRHVTYLGDGDTKDLIMLEEKLKRACRRALQLGLSADYVITDPGTDLNDLLRGAA